MIWIHGDLPYKCVKKNSILWMGCIPHERSSKETLLKFCRERPPLMLLQHQRSICCVVLHLIRISVLYDSREIVSWINKHSGSSGEKRYHEMQAIMQNPCRECQVLQNLISQGNTFHMGKAGICNFQHQVLTHTCSTAWPMPTYACISQKHHLPSTAAVLPGPPSIFILVATPPVRSTSTSPRLPPSSA